MSITRPVVRNVVRSVVRGDTPSPSTALLFAESATKILNRNSPGARSTVVDGAGDITVTIYNTNSTINGTSLTGGGLVDEKDVPFGYSCPIRGSWILTEPQAPVDPDPSINFANGMSNLFVFEGQVFEFKGGTLGDGSFALRWSEDDGVTWKQIYNASSDDQNWYQFDFGSVGTRIVEVIGCDQTLALNGYNFDTGATPPLLYADPDLPLITMFGDSYVFGQNADTLDNTTGGGTNPNDQKAISGMCRQFGEKLGALQVRNHGLRGNRFRPGQSNRSNYADRLSGGVYPSAAEALFAGDAGGEPRDLFVMPTTINDDSASDDPTLRPAVAEAFRRLRELQPNCVIIFPVGARAPQFSESDHWLDNNKDGFTDVFGTTEAEWIQNGVYLVDGSRRDGANWDPSGAEGSSPNYGGVGFDSGHPTETGYDYLSGKYADGAIYAAQEIVKEATLQGYGTELFNDNWTSIGASWTDNGDLTYTCDGTSNSSLGLNISEIEAGKAYVVRLTVSGSVGELRVRLGGGSNQSITADGDYIFVLDDNSSAGLIFQALNSFSGTVSNVSCIALY